MTKLAWISASDSEVAVTEDVIKSKVVQHIHASINPLPPFLITNKSGFWVLRSKADSSFPEFHSLCYRTHGRHSDGQQVNKNPRLYYICLCVCSPLSLLSCLSSGSLHPPKTATNPIIQHPPPPQSVRECHSRLLMLPISLKGLIFYTEQCVH